MPAEPPLPGGFLSLQHNRPFVLDDGASRSLHFTLGELQSRMRLDSPCALEVDYTRTMMGFLLFNPSPAHIGMIGLGGGSIAKFCHRFLPASRMTVLEINPHVIVLRNDFQVPPDDERFEVLAARPTRHAMTCCWSTALTWVASPLVCAASPFTTTAWRPCRTVACWWSTCTTTIPTMRYWSGEFAAALAATRLRS
jgi:hypothetical protein